MKAKITLFLSMCIAASFFSIPAYSQEKIVETKYFKSNPDLGGDVVIYSSTKEVTGDESRTIFEFEAKTSGSYALSLWASPVLYPGGNYSSFDVYVNGTKTAEQVKFTKGNWQAVTFPERVNIEQGVNTIAFSTGKEEIPAIEFIRLSTNVDGAKISSAKYDDYLATITAKADSLNYAGQRPINTADSLYSEPSQLQADPVTERTNKLRPAESSTGLNNDIRYSNEDKFNVTNNGAGISINFTLSEKAKVSLSVINLRGEEIVSILRNGQLQAGEYNYSAGLTKGIYLVKQVVNGNVNVKKVIIN